MKLLEIDMALAIFFGVHPRAANDQNVRAEVRAP
jgi:hypothetical protein